MAAAAAETLLKSGEVSAMIKQGFLSSPSVPSSPPSSAISPPSPPLTLFQMIARDDTLPRPLPPAPAPTPMPTPTPTPSADQHLQRRIRVQDRISRILAGEKPDWGAGDVEITISSGDGFRVAMWAHRRVLAGRSRFFAEKLGKRGVSVEICECDDVEVYAEVVALMYCGDLRRRLVGEEVKKVLGLIKVSSAIMFDAAVAACLDFLEAVPWSEYEEEEVISVVSQLQLQALASDTLQRVSADPSTSSTADAVFLQLLSGILQAKDEKARRSMKVLVSGLLREDRAGNNDICERLDVSKEAIYQLCYKCLSSMHLCLSEAATIDESRRDRANLLGEIAREADNVQWLVEILINQKMGDEFVMLWADQTELASLHSKIPCMYRFEISRITAQLCIAVGKGLILVPKDARFSMLRTWLEALYDDFGWMKRACRGLDKKMVEDGLCQTILTLPMAQQQSILLRWFDRFLKKGDDCPNIHRAFEVWWRRAFVRRFTEVPDQSQLQIAVCDYRT